MADSAISITAGSGTNVDTRTESTNSNHRQVIVLGDPSNNDGIVAVTSSDAGVATTEMGAVVRPIMQDAGKLRVSSLNSDAGSFHVSSFIDSGSISAKQGDASNLRVSSVGSISVSADNVVAPTDAVTVQSFGVLFDGSTWDRARNVAALGDAGTAAAAVGVYGYNGSTWDRLRGTVSGLDVTQHDGSFLRISGIQSDATNLNVSAKSSDATNMRVSAFNVPQTAGGLSTFISVSVSASQNVKSSAGQIYGYYAFNKSTVISFLKIYDVSGAVNLGTDTPKMILPLPISGGANVFSQHGVAFSNGIGIAATSGAPLDNTALPAASAVSLTLFYK